MPDTARDLIKQTISNTPGTAGSLTLSTASTGYLALGASDDGKTFTVLISASDSDTAAKEMRSGCTYTHSATTLTRGTLVAGTAIDLTSSAVVSVVMQADSGRRWDAAALEHSTVTGTSGAISAAVNTLYVADMSGWTADRTLTLPATAAVGDRVGVMVSVGDDAYEWLITAASGDTLNAVAGGTEWSRVFITGETVVMRCTAADSTWVVEQDGRIPQVGMMSRTVSDATTSATGWSATTLDTIDLERGCDASTSGVGTITWRRESYVEVCASWQAKAGGACADNEQLGWGCTYGGGFGVGTLVCSFVPNHPGTSAKPLPATLLGIAAVPAGSALQLNQYAATTSNLGARALNTGSFLRVLEIFK